MQDLKGVWSELSKVWEQIDQMKEQPWVSVQPRKVSLGKAGAGAKPTDFINQCDRDNK